MLTGAVVGVRRTMPSSLSCCCPTLPQNPVQRFRKLLENLQVKLGLREAGSHRKQIFECILHLYVHEVSPYLSGLSCLEQPGAVCHAVANSPPPPTL